MIYLKKGSNLCVIFKKLNGSILCVIFKKLNGSIHKKYQFCGSDSKIQFCEVFFIDEKTLSLEKKKGPFLWIKNFQKSSSIWVTWKRRFNSLMWKRSKYLNHEKKKKEQFFESNWEKKFNSLSHIFNKKIQSFEWYPRRVQFFQFFEG